MEIDTIKRVTLHMSENPVNLDMIILSEKINVLDAKIISDKQIQI